jgi:O-antigen/teichoic acid export membrane protein
MSPADLVEPPDVLDTEAAGGMLVRGSVLRFGSYVGVVALSVLSAALLTRHLGVGRFGQYTTVISLVSLVAAVTDAGMSNLGTREFAVLEGAERTALMRDLLGLRVAMTLGGLILATVFVVVVGYGPALVAGTVVAGLATVALVLQHTLSIPLAAELRLGAISLLDLARQALSVAAIVVLISLDAGLFPLLAVTLVVYLVLMPVSVALARGRISLRVELRPHRWVALLRPTLAFSLATAVGTIYIYVGQILTSFVASPHQSGLFAVSFRVFIVATGVPGLLVSGTLPLLARAARDDHERLSYGLQKIFEVSAVVGVATALGVLAGAQFIVAVVAGPQFAGAAAVLRIQGLAMAVSFLIAGWGVALISLKLYGAAVVANAVALVTSVTLTLVLASTHGARGAALATVGAELTLASGTLVALLRAHPELRPRLTVLPKVAFAAAPALALTLALVGELSSLVRTVLALTVYGLLILLTRALPQEILELIPRRRRAQGG